jgi:hypothetical protein
MANDVTSGDTNELDSDVVDDEYAGVREEIERVIPDDTYPADKDRLRDVAIDNGADDGTIRLFERLPDHVRFNSSQEIVEKSPTHRPGG